MPLSWRIANASDHSDLRDFCCAFPHRISRDAGETPGHPRPYQVFVEVEVQQLEPPLGDGRQVLLGHDDEGLAVVAVFQLAQAGDSPPWHFINLAARANRCHGTSCADELLQELIRRLTRISEDEFVQSAVYCKVDPRNRASMAWLARNGFEHMHTDRFEWWARELS